MQPPYHKRELGPKQIYKFSPTTDQLASDWTAAGGGGAGVIPPLWLTQVDNFNVFVVFGQVNGISPTGVATNIDVSGTDGTWAIYLAATLDGSGVPTAVAVGTSAPGGPGGGTVPSDDATNAYKLIGYVTVASGVITVVTPSLAWSQTFVCCTPGDTGTYYWVVT